MLMLIALLLLIFLVICWPAAVVLLVLSPIWWLLTLPLRLIGLVAKRPRATSASSEAALSPHNE